jgi:hypothetical protein
VKALLAAARVLFRAEAALQLIDRAVPSNLESERNRLLQVAARGGRLLPEFRYSRFPQASELRLALSGLARDLAANDPVSDLLAARASELALEAALVEALGTPAFARLAAERFPAPEGEEARRVGELVTSFAASAPSTAAGVELFASDGCEPNSLVRLIDRELGSQRSAVRVELRRELASIAASGDGVIYVRPGMLLSAREAERIAHHEVYAHALPRIAARSQPDQVFRAGTAGSSEDEEGRALLIESRAGLLGPERRRELALRHRLVLELRAGKSFADSFANLLTQGFDAKFALELVIRIHRGGGLGREIAYLPAFLRVSQAFTTNPRLERLMERGRVSIEAARVLTRIGILEGTQQEDGRAEGFE